MKMKDIDGTRNPYIILNVIDSSLYKQLFIWRFTYLWGWRRSSVWMKVVFSCCKRKLWEKAAKSKGEVVSFFLNNGSPMHLVLAGRLYVSVLWYRRRVPQRITHSCLEELISSLSLLQICPFPTTGQSTSDVQPHFWLDLVHMDMVRAKAIDDWCVLCTRRRNIQSHCAGIMKTYTWWDER